MKVLVGQAYHLAFDPKPRAAMEPYPPLGSLQAAAVIRQAGHEVVFSDSMLAPDTGNWGRAVQRESPDLAVLHEDSFNYLTKMCLSVMRDAALDMIARARRAGAMVVVCGSDATDRPETYLDGGADLVLLGEGEASLREVLSALEEGGQPRWNEIPGLAFLDKTGRLRRTPKRPVIKDVESLPFPAWELADLEGYRKIWRDRHGYFSINMVTSRGCPYQCNWCAKPIWGQGYHCRSPESVVAEITRLKAMVAIDHIWFMDDIFGLQPGWIRRFAERLNASAAQTPFKCLSRADLLLREGETEALRAAGAQTVWIGAESGSQAILDAMEKGTTLAQIEQATRALRAAGIHSGHFIQFGYPGEDWGQVMDSLRMIRRLRPDHLGISVSYPLPGTPFFERVRADLGDQKNWLNSDDLAMLYRGPFSTSFYRLLHRLVHADRRLRLSLRKVWSRQPASLAARLRKLASSLVALSQLALLWPRLFLARITSARGGNAARPGPLKGATARLSPRSE